MKTIITLFFLFICYNCFAQTQTEMNLESYDEYKRSDSTLNSIYKLVKQKHKGDTAFINKLVKAQKVWVQFRDAEMDALFPHEDESLQYYSSMFPLCWNTIKTNFTLDRIKTLRLWLDGVEEDGDGCHGSIPWKE